MIDNVDSVGWNIDCLITLAVSHPVPKSSIKRASILPKEVLDVHQTLDLEDMRLSKDQLIFDSSEKGVWGQQHRSLRDAWEKVVMLC